MGTPLVSVIVPNYNYARYLPLRLDSILSQTFQDFEVIILDDCSTDESASVIEGYRSNPNVSHVIINERNSGSPFKQWEKGISLARGKYIWIAEADDLAEPTFLERTVAAINNDENVMLAITLSDVIDENGDRRLDALYDSFKCNDTMKVFSGRDFVRHKMMVFNNVYNASMVLFRKDAWANIQCHDYMNMRYCGDWLFWILIMMQGEIALIPEKLNKFRKHGTSVSDDGDRNIAKPAREVLMLKSKAVSLALDNCFDDRVMFEYRSLRDRKSGFTDEIFRSQGIKPKRYPLYWIYRHMFRWTRKLGHKGIAWKLVPLRSEKLAKL